MNLAVGRSDGVWRWAPLPAGSDLKINPEIGSSRREPRISQEGEIDKQEMGVNSHETLTHGENRLVLKTDCCSESWIQVSSRISSGCRLASVAPAPGWVS